jgi:uncharacterized phiE125 gp8 family phage protein
MTIVQFAAPATEPLTVAEVMRHLRIDDGNQEPAPGAPTVALASPAAAGNVDNGAHRYGVTFVTSSGETQLGVVSSAVTVSDRTVNGKVNLTAIPLGSSAVTSRKIYRTTAGGSTYLLLSTIADNTTTTYLDNIADASLGAGAPSTNSTTDPVFTALIASARAAAELELGRYLITQTLDMYLDEFPCEEPYEIYLPPIQSVSAITYVDSAGVTQTLSAPDYLVDSNSKPARITPAYGLYWPYTREQNNAVKVRFIAGYGSASSVPDCIKQWMLMRIADLWTNRASLVIDPRGLIQIPRSYVDGLLDPERVHGRL